MKYIKQLFIILVVSLTGELIHFFLPFPIPASIYGLVIMFLLLEAKIIKLEKVKDVSSFFLGIMPVFFVPPCVGFINALPLMKKHGIQFFIIGIGTTFLVMIATGYVTQALIKLRKKIHHKKNPEGKNAVTE